MGNSFSERYGCVDLSREATKSGHFSLYAGKNLVGHVLSGSIQDAYYYFVKQFGLDSLIVNHITPRRITFVGYFPDNTRAKFTLNRTVWKPQYNTPMLPSYGISRY